MERIQKKGSKFRITDGAKRLMGAIASVESGGDWQAVGNKTEYGRAYGRYQVLEDNVTNWTHRLLFDKMSVAEWLNDKEAQRLTIGLRFTNLLERYSTKEVIRIHFSGTPNAPKHWSDANGMTVGNYTQKVLSNI